MLSNLNLTYIHLHLEDILSTVYTNDSIYMYLVCRVLECRQAYLTVWALQPICWMVINPWRACAARVTVCVCVCVCVCGIFNCLGSATNLLDGH